MTNTKRLKSKNTILEDERLRYLDAEMGSARLLESLLGYYRKRK